MISTKEVMTLDIKITDGEKEQIERYFKKKRDEFNWSDQKIINHLYYHLLTRASDLNKKLGHLITKKHLTKTCPSGHWCTNRLIEDPQAQKRKMDFRIKALIYMHNQSTKGGSLP